MKLKTLLLAGMVMIPATLAAQSAQAGYCREYGNTISIGGKTEGGYGTVCLQPDGSWKVVVNSGNDGHYDDRHERRRDDRYDDRHESRHDDRHDGHNHHKYRKHKRDAYANHHYYGYREPYYMPVKRFPPGHFRRYSQRSYYESINPHNHRHTPHCGHHY